MINGLFDIQFRLDKIDRNGDPLVGLKQIVPWEDFRAPLMKLRKKKRKSTAGATGYDLVMMFKVLVLQSLYNLSDDATEVQILDRLSFMRFLGLCIGDKVPDAKTIWLFREQLSQAGLERTLFKQFDAYLRDNGFAAKKGQIIDASIVQIPKQRNTREENQKIKEGRSKEIQGWSEPKKRQKDTNARWTKKSGKTFYGYKNHVQIDVKEKFIRDYDVTDASVHDSNVFEDLLDEANSSRDVWADSAYRSAQKRANLEAAQFRQHIQRKATRNKKLTARELLGNHTRSKTRSRVEHIFGVQAQKMGNTILRCIGIVRARCKIGLRNLAYNLDRYAMLRAVAP